jgi:2OG-Fe(II) oxygenase superfamily
MAEIEAGDVAPRFDLKLAEGGRFDLGADEVAGTTAVLLFPRSGTLSDLDRFASAQERFAQSGARLCAVLPHPPEVALPGLAAAIDPDGMVASRYGMSGRDAIAVVVAPNQHVAALCRGAAMVDDALAAIARIRDRNRAEAGAHPPVLVVPDVLSVQDCKRLIGIYAMRGHRWVEPGHGNPGLTTDYKMRIPEYGRRDRIDHWVIDQDTNAFIDGRLQSRLFPEIRKAFQYNITRRETYRIGCYEGERGGEPHGHRDNTQPNVAHRRFAASINLNTEEFEGGGIRFPEFGGPGYRPATGAAIAFSSSLLHEALQVTRGRRYVLLSFLFGEV